MVLSPVFGGPSREHRWPAACPVMPHGMLRAARGWCIWITSGVHCLC